MDNSSNSERYTEQELLNEAEQMRDLVESGLAENYIQAESLVEAHKRVFQLIDDLSKRTGERIGGVDYASEVFWRELPNTIDELPSGDTRHTQGFYGKIQNYISPTAGKEENYAVSGENTLSLELRRKFVDEMVKAAGLLSEEDIDLFQKTRLSSIFCTQLSAAGPEPNLNAILRAKDNLDKLREKIGEQKFAELKDFVELAHESFRSFVIGYPKLFSVSELQVLLPEYLNSPERKRKLLGARKFVPRKIFEFLRAKYPDEIDINEEEYVVSELAEKYPNIFAKLNENQEGFAQSIVHSKDDVMGDDSMFNTYLLDLKADPDRWKRDAAYRLQNARKKREIYGGR